MDAELELETILAHADLDDDEASVAPPIHQSVNFVAASAEDFDVLNTVANPPRYYRRSGNPTAARLEKLIAAIEGAETGLVTASGMGAVSTTLLTFLSSGDHVVAQKSMYGGVLSLLQDELPRFGIDATLVDQTDNDAFERAITPRTRMVMLETPSNPLLQITDLRAVAEIARQRGALTFIDNTVATPINQRPIEHGIDLVMHSVTKGLSGHSDVLAGAVVGEKMVVDRIWNTHIRLGAVVSPFDAWLALRGMRTLTARVDHQNRSAAAVASFLAGHPAVKVVHYPGLTSHPQHALATSQMHGFGGLLSFELHGGRDAAEHVISELKLAVRSPSLGGMRTTLVRPAAMWANELTEQQLVDAGVPGGLLRYAVGLEGANDLITDLSCALDTLGTST